MTDVAIWQMRDVFEEDWMETKLQAESYIKYSLEALQKMVGTSFDQACFKLRSGLVGAASRWILINGSNLFTEMVQTPKQIKTDTLEASLLRVGPLFDGPIYGKQRWSFWREGFEKAAGGAGVGEECATLAKKAVDMMLAFERNMWH
ncbi:uncharacterized protein HMPREF1541_03014 [Cyphellophora europaea CBS 101466]|uniref:Uncharacterized protein n=1 Tax=Cyphellophora europaea (strain CBS 101466) TaxID=1220924 RepID=W2RZH2_CYPE1|nr:uncharacterized protein HMPREF1541_03014 [Cyphellophora europaea CBS 101466]ETN41079.1 hypothetical protein HMPREF1541_03014 [Cyphellophora europaea CBS 101466]